MNTEHVISCNSSDFSDSNEDSLSDSNGIQYSCTDMDSRIGESTHYSYDGHDSSISGSYVVDPNELVKEIDELFFKDMVV